MFSSGFEYSKHGSSQEKGSNGSNTRKHDLLGQVGILRNIRISLKPDLSINRVKKEKSIIFQEMEPFHAALIGCIFALSK